MAKRIKTRSESGVALLIAIFTLMLLTALGLALLGAADLETKIAANYRDKQNSIYASLSGLQEARDRMIPSRCDTPLGTFCDDPIAIDWRSLSLPTSGSNTNIVYIINPDTTMGETTASVAPWSPLINGKVNNYYDTELCSNPYFSTLCTGGAQPNLSTAYQVYDDSQSSAGEYYATKSSLTFPYPLKYKWVRISLKADNMTPVNAQSPANGTQMCWNGTYQVPVTSGAGYNSACKGVGGIVLYNPITSTQCTTCTFGPLPAGSGYSANPTVTIGAPGGAGTTATAKATTQTVSNGLVNSITVTNQGSAYTTAPTVTITDPTGTGATAKAYLGNSAVASYTVASQSSPKGCYSSSTPVVAVSGGDGSGATAVAAMTGQTCIANWSVGVSGCASSGPKSVLGNTYSVKDTGGNGSFAGTIKFNSGSPTIASYSITNPGSGYTSNPGVIDSNGNKLAAANCTFTITWTRGYQVTGVNLDAGVNPGGSGYTIAPTVTLPMPSQPPAQAAPAVTATLGGSTGKVTSVVVTSSGSGYSSTPTVTFSGGGGTLVAATANVGTYTGISSITLLTAGSGYTSNPTVTIGPPGSGATIQAQAQQSQLGRIYMVTALAVTPSGSKTMTQMEVATPPAFPFTMPGALVLDAPGAQLNAANSNNYQIVGTDQNSCGETAVAPKAAVGVFDNPSNPTNPTETACITAELGGPTAGSCTAQTGIKPTNYPGKNPSPDVENVYSQLGDLTTVPGADALATTVISQATTGYVYGTPGPYSVSNPMPTTTSIAVGTPPNCPTTVVYGNLTVNGNITGCGPLLVTGTMTLGGTYTWDGPVFVIGQGVFNGAGGGNGQINGSLFVATTVDSSSTNPSSYGNPLATLGTPTVSFNINGGGGNGIHYDHCWSDNMISTLTNPAKSPQPLKVLSVRTVY